MIEFKPSYEVYRQIVRDIQRTGKECKYDEAINRGEFVIMRHDVEFSLERAYNLSLVESEMDFTSTYFVQITNNSYNALSKRGIDIMRDMASRGHVIGLHYHLNGQSDMLAVRDGVRDQLRIMSEMVGLPINTYSFHRPTKEVYYYKIRIDGTYNAYGTEYFTYAENVDETTWLDVKYLADSKHRWNYGYPDYETFCKYPKVQLLIHPFSWSAGGYDNMNNFYYLIQEKQATLIDTLGDEFMRFKEVETEVKSRLGIDKEGCHDFSW